MNNVQDIVFTSIRAFMTVLNAALDGDETSQIRLKDILPHESYNGVVKVAQDKLDREKFGARPGE